LVLAAWASHEQQLLLRAARVVSTLELLSPTHLFHMSVVAAGDGSSEVVATGPTAAGTCVITATVAFANSSALTASATITVVGMTSLALATLDFNTIALPQPLLNSQLLAGDSLVLLKCDATNYAQVRQATALWHGATSTLMDSMHMYSHCF
jgi:hypothetical protein